RLTRRCDHPGALDVSDGARAVDGRSDQLRADRNVTELRSAKGAGRRSRAQDPGREKETEEETKEGLDAGGGKQSLAHRTRGPPTVLGLFFKRYLYDVAHAGWNIWKAVAHGNYGLFKDRLDRFGNARLGCDV